ncbi:SOS response-associated peptidase [Aestuariibacter sp. AA17]|uniref:Abasic site processing protein n=1 Tax=Fluctibacter corallii TaxID=2984329 RepID=A0ABT3ABT8_9ALTE|nr:SOS response-associated peptidase [Aestuariibacter sp. AA17]MCV2885727.1 SOS response-associated peptidase [Aestuariibacter sp. AA17]
MCGRYANHVGAMHGWSDILDSWPQQLELGFNVSPSMMIPVFTPSGGQAMRWGVIPPWLDRPSSQYATFNARLSSVAEKPTFRRAWRQGQRCLIPAIGYFEWKPVGNVKQPYFVRPKDNAPLVFGGIFETGSTGKYASCAILTRPAQGGLATLHHAMPVFINRASAESWLEADVTQAESIAWQDYDESCYFYPVSQRVNRASERGAELIEEITREVPTQTGFDF